ELERLLGLDDGIDAVDELLLLEDLAQQLGASVRLQGEHLGGGGRAGADADAEASGLDLLPRDVRVPERQDVAGYGRAHARRALTVVRAERVMRIKSYDLLSKDEVHTIHEQAMTILEEIGVDFLHERARSLFQQAGMRVEDNRVRFERAFVMEQVAKTPSTFELQARNPTRSVTLGGDNVVTAPVYGPPFVTDLDRGRRGATIEYFTYLDKLSQAVQQIH